MADPADSVILSSADGDKKACDRELAGRAQDLFDELEFDRCVVTLELLAKDRPDDPKVAHNLAIARYYSTRGVDGTIRLQDELAKVFLMSREYTRLGTGGYDDDCESAVAAYNYAVLQYQNGQFAKAISILEPRIHLLDAVMEPVAKKICFLLLDLYLVTVSSTSSSVDRSVPVLQHLEKLLLQVTTGVKIDKAPEAPSDSPDDEKNTPLDSDALRFYLHQYRARGHIISRAMKACKREIKSALNLRNQNATALFIKSNFEYVRRNYRKAIKLLNSFPKAQHISGQGLTTLYYNNMGCLHLQMGKTALAKFYFDKALTSNEKDTSKNTSGGEPLTFERRHELLYNQGLTLLHGKKPALALACFEGAGNVLFRSPRLWLRMAECAIMLYTDKVQASQYRADLHGAVLHHVGVGATRKCVLIPSPSVTTEHLSTAIKYLRNALILSTPPAAPAPPTAPAVPDSPDHASVPGIVPITVGQSAALPDLAATPPLGASGAAATELTGVRCHVLAALAYASLGVGNHIDAVRYGEQLLSESSCQGPLKFLGHMYVAEALVFLKRVPEAMKHLSPAHVAELAAYIPPSPEPLDGEKADADTGTPVANADLTAPPPFSPDFAKAVLCINLAATYCTKGEYAKASTCLGEVQGLSPSSDLSGQMVMLSIYIELAQGNTKGALAIAQQHRLPGTTA